MLTKKLNQVKATIEDDALYQERQHILYDMNMLYDMKNIPDIALDVHDNLQAIAEKHAYKQGFIDSLTLMTELSS